MKEKMLKLLEDGLPILTDAFVVTDRCLVMGLQVELIPLEELGRPRVDATGQKSMCPRLFFFFFFRITHLVVSCSGLRYFYTFQAGCVFVHCF